MENYDKRKLGKQAQELGFTRDTLEKECRLAEILKHLNTDPLLENALALKGGTAINFSIFNLPRMSIDLDPCVPMYCQQNTDQLKHDGIMENENACRRSYMTQSIGLHHQ